MAKKNIEVDGEKIELEWHEIDPASLKKGTGEEYAAYKAAFQQTKALRQKFEASLRSDCPMPEGRKLAIAYNFGKLSVANAPADGKKPSSKALPLKDIKLFA